MYIVVIVLFVGHRFLLTQIYVCRGQVACCTLVARNVLASEWLIDLKCLRNLYETHP